MFSCFASKGTFIFILNQLNNFIIRIFYIAIICISTQFIISCNNDKEEAPEPDIYSPIITFLEPGEGEEITSGDELHMEVDFNYTGNTIHHVGLWIINEETLDTVYNYEFHADIEDYFNLHEHYVTDVADTTNYSVIAYSTNHDESQIVTKLVHVIIIP